jgi:hypothetical protein
VGAAGLLTHYGISELDLVLLVVGAVLLGLVVVGAGSVLLGALLLRFGVGIRASSAPLFCEAGTPVLTGFALRRWWFLPWLHVEWSWGEPRAEVRVEVVRGWRLETVRVAQRARVEAVVRRVHVADAFGLARVSLSVAERSPTCVLPALGALRRIELASRFAGGDAQADPSGDPLGDRADLRRYAPGDPVRYVLWKVFARSRQTFVRIPERAVSPGDDTLGVLVTGAEDEASAAAARRAIESGALGERWSFLVDGEPALTAVRSQALEALCKSSEPGGAPHAASWPTAADSRTRIVLFVPARSGSWLSRTCEAVRDPRVRRRVQVVIGVDEVAPSPARVSGWRARVLAWLRAGSREPLAQDARELERVLSAFAELKVPVTLVDRSRGAVRTGQLLRRRAA